MNEHEDKFVSTFLLREKRDRYRLHLANPKKRGKLLDRLNHTPDFDPRFMNTLPSNVDAAHILRQHGSPTDVYLISSSEQLDGKTLPLDEAVSETEFHGWGTLISCIPGRLAYYYGEAGETRALLERKV